MYLVELSLVDYASLRVRVCVWGLGRGQGLLQ